MKLKKLARVAILAAAAGVVTGANARAADITGAGSTFAYPILSKWAEAYKAATGNGLNYQSIGSGAGIKQIESKTVTFGASDQPLTVDDLNKNSLSQFPFIMGAIVMVVNLDGVKAGDMVLDGPTVADIYLGKITKWNDPAIKKLNPSLNLPATAISVVERSDGSGTTFNFTDYLSKVSADWKSKVGENTAVEWPAGIGAKGSEGVSGTIAQTKGAIGFVEYAYAQQNNLPYTDMINKDGKKVAPTMETFTAAASNADWVHAPGYYQILTQEPGATSWPLTASTFALFQKEPTDKAASAEAIKFFDWAFANGGKAAQELDYIPMPDNVVALIKKTWASDIKNK
ncbi:MAG TPA: phosphate ABC transporter substrate-binding protein PstS [Beijerinckiaceae bacterium]|jgi:phosphate transport system substrate-binding protein|nr:phosphate ABC transporter substrate-binding protein PstS [Beijerinckiaceae bacterium]